MPSNQHRSIEHDAQAYPLTRLHKTPPPTLPEGAKSSPVRPTVFSRQDLRQLHAVGMEGRFARRSYADFMSAFVPGPDLPDREF